MKYAPRSLRPERHSWVDLDPDAFVRDGYGAVGVDTVAACREITWAAMERRGVG